MPPRITDDRRAPAALQAARHASVDFTHLAYLIDQVRERFPGATEIKPILTGMHATPDALFEVWHGRCMNVVVA